MRYNIKARLAMLGMTSVNMIDLLRKRGIDTDTVGFSLAINWRRRTEKSERICEVTDEILTELENKKG